MNIVKHKACFGVLFPDMPQSKECGLFRGKVFSVDVVPSGGLSGAGHSIDTNLHQWDKCQHCPEFDSCYRLSMAKVALETAIAR